MNISESSEILDDGKSDYWSPEKVIDANLIKDKNSSVQDTKKESLVQNTIESKSSESIKWWKVLSIAG